MQRDPMVAEPVATSAPGHNVDSTEYIKGINDFQATRNTLAPSTPLIVPGTSCINVQPGTTAAVNSASSATTSRDAHSSPVMGESGQSATTAITTGISACTVLLSSGVPAGKAVPENMCNKIITHRFVELSDLRQCRTPTDYELRLNSDTAVSFLFIQPKRKKDLSETEWAQAWDEFTAVC